MKAFSESMLLSPLLNLVGHKKVELGRLMDEIQSVIGKKKVGK